MKKEKTEKETTYLISDSFGNTKEKGTYEIAFRRWLVREIDSGRITIGEASERFNLNAKSVPGMVRHWRKKYGSEIALTLPVMTEKERQKLEALQKRMKELEKQLENAQMKNAALETIIDVAEEQLKISIRKKSGPKQ
jgi:transposase-like protein